MLDQNILTCETIRNRYKQVVMINDYGMDGCDNCDEIIQKYIHYLWMEQYATPCAVAYTCATVTGTACDGIETITPCGTVEFEQEQTPCVPEIVVV